MSLDADDRCSANDRDGISWSEALVAAQHFEALLDKLATIYSDEAHNLFGCGRNKAWSEFRDFLSEHVRELPQVPDEVRECL